MKKLYIIIERIVQFFSFYISSICLLFRKSKLTDLMDNINVTRIPNNMIKAMPKGVKENNIFLAGKKIEFETEATHLKLLILYKKRIEIENMSSISTSGVDIYKKENDEYIWIGCISPDLLLQMTAKGEFFLGEGKKNIVIFLPSFAVIKNIYSYNEIKKVVDKKETDIVVYGSSISHGCAASRAGLSYVNIIARKLNKNIENYGFSGSAKGEKEIVDFISKRSCKIFILEYDHNSNLEEFRERHLKVYSTIRTNNPNCFIIMLSRISGGISISTEEANERISIINTTYEYAKKNNDNRLCFINGSTIAKDKKDFYLADNKHPNDNGMQLIANEIINEIKERGL